MPGTKMNVREKLEDTTLDLSMLQLEDVPVKEIAQIKKGTTLDLSNNRLKSLGKSFAPSLMHLVKLDLSKNILTELPDNIGELVNLRHLDLYSNMITHLPLSFGNLKALRWLDLKNNPLMPKLAEVAGPCLDAQQCQQCARKVVNFLQTMQILVEEERQRRLEQRSQQELADQVQKKEQQQSKRGKKKKAAKSAGKTQIQTKDENGVENLLTYMVYDALVRAADEQKNVPPREREKGYIVFFVLKKIVKTFLIGLPLSLFLVYLVNREKYIEIQEQAMHVWNVILSAMPVAFVDMFNSMQPKIVGAWDCAKSTYVHISSHPAVVPVLDSVWQGALSTFNNTKAAYVKVSSDATVQHFVETFIAAWNAMCAVVVDVGRTLYQEVPLYFETMKNTIF